MALRYSEHMGSSSEKVKAFTLIEILVVVTIIFVLLSLLLPTMFKVRAGAREAFCINNLRQIGMAVAMYKSDFEQLPPHISSIHPSYLTDASVFLCKDDPAQGRHDGGDYLEGNLYLPSGVSYTYIPNWKYAQQLRWWRPPPRYGEGKWGDATPLAMCHWHWAGGRRWLKDLDNPSWGENGKGWVLVLAAGGSVHRVRAEAPASDFSPRNY